jgi:hypothetical protein
MMKKLAVVLVVALVTVLVSAVAAQPSAYNSGYQVANLSSDTATISIQYVNQDGTVAATVDDTIPGDGSTTYFPIGAGAGFNGSVVISSDQPVAAIVNVLGDGFAFGEAYESFTEGSDTANLPLIMKGNFNFNTWFNVQNASSPGGTPVDVEISYAGTTCTETATIPAGAAATFNQATNTCLPTPYVGAATVTATGGNVVAAVMQVGPTTLFAYNSFTDGSTEPVMPLVQGNNFGYFTGIQVQNTGAVATDVTVSYVPGESGVACSQTETIAAGASATYQDCSNMSVPTFIGGAAVSNNSADQPLVAIVNQLNLGQGKGAAYSGFAPASATETVNFPLIMQANFGFFTGFNVYNAGAANAEVTCVFSGTGAPSTVVATVEPGDTLTSIQLGATTYVGSVQCNAPGGSIVGVANELSSAAGDNLFAYGGFNQ